MVTTNAIQSFEARDLRLKAVTIFNDRAEVVREFSVELEQGLTDVIVNNVAATLDSESVRVSLSGATLQKVEYRENKAKNLLEQQAHQSKLTSKKRLRQAYEDRVEMLNNIVTNAPLQSDYVVMDRNFGSFDELFTFQMEQIGKVDVLLQGVDAEIAELESWAKQKSIVITLESATKANVRIELAYQASRAWWSPNYELCVTSDTKHATLHYFATIQQATGEDWDDAEIELSTAQTRRAVSVPKLETLNARLHRRETPRSTRLIEDDGTGVEYVGRARRRSVHPTMSDVSDEPDKFKEMHVEKHLLSSTFKVPQKTSVASGSSEHKVTIARPEFDLLMGLECYPSVKTDVFESASAINNSGYPLLHGPAAIYVDHKFTSTTTIHATANGEKFVFALGVDSDIKVKYTSSEPFHKQSDDEETPTYELYEKKIHVKNLKANAKALVTFHLQVPRSADSKIKIELLAPAKNELVAAEDASTPKPPAIGPRLNGDNILDWTVQLNEGEERELVVKWSVQSPADETVEFVARSQRRMNYSASP